MAEKWAEECAQYEARGTADYVRAALIYERQAAKGWSPQSISDAVGEAGARISWMTVTRRLNALEAARATNARVNSKAFLEAFSEAYAHENRKDRGGFGGGQTDLDDETRLSVYLEGVAREFERLFAEPQDLTTEDIANVRVIRDGCDAVLTGRPVLRMVETG